jgi:hypothetical protein
MTEKHRKQSTAHLTACLPLSRALAKDNEFYGHPQVSAIAF